MIAKIIFSLIVILAGAELFTNAVEWLGYKLRLSEGAVGSILAAVGTALPESIIPIVAIFFTPGSDNSHIGIGAILGAPFMLGTLAFFITGLTSIICHGREVPNNRLKVDINVISRDISFFIIVYSLAIGCSFVEDVLIKKIITILLVFCYILYVFLTLKNGKSLEHGSIKSLYFCPWLKSPHLVFIIIQIIMGLGAIILGAEVFVSCINYFSKVLLINPLVLALILAPVATELPEKFNSIIWIVQGKDTLALGNITGAMVFQSSIIPAIGISFTSWKLSIAPLLSSFLVLISVLFVLMHAKIRGYISSNVLMVGGIFYLIYISFIIGIVIN